MKKCGFGIYMLTCYFVGDTFWYSEDEVGSVCQCQTFIFKASLMSRIIFPTELPLGAKRERANDAGNPTWLPFS